MRSLPVFFLFFQCISLLDSQMLNSSENLVCVILERPPRMRQVAGLIPGWVKLKTLKMVVMAAFLGDQVCRVSVTSDWLVLR